MKLLVTGGSGFIGSNFILYWLKNHPEDFIINFDKLTYAGNPENLTEIENSHNYQFIKGDICQPAAVELAMRDVEMVVHFAAETHVDRSILGPSVFVKTNVLGTQVLLEAAVKNKIKRFHHVSTDEVFGSLLLETGEKFNEDSAFRPNSPYAASKAGSDLLVRSYFQTFGLPVTITNTSNNYGPYQFPEKLIPLMIINAIENRPLPIYGDGLNVRDWLYVEDHCRAIELVLRKGKAGETYCIGGNAERSNLTVVKQILACLKKSEDRIVFVKDRPGHDRRYAIDSAKSERELGYRPLADFETWLEKTVSWYMEHQSWWKRVMSQEYRNYYKKQYQKRLEEN